MPEHYLSILAGLIVGVLLAIVPLEIMRRRARLAKTRSEENLCLACGYDMRASKDRCPECGEKSFRRLDKLKLRKPPPEVGDVPTVPIANLSTIVHQTTDPEEARLLVLQLEARNIPALRTDSDLEWQPYLLLLAVRVGEDHQGEAERIVGTFEADEIG